VLDGSAFADPMLAGRFEREAMATSSLRSPHIVQVFDWGLLPEGGYFLVMELLPGCDLAALMLRGGLLGPRRTLSVLRQLAIAIDHAHEHGIIHRDLKPENVMIDQDAGDFVKVLDFGVARDLRVDTSFTSYGEVVGTPEYMAPEQALGLGDRIGPAADRWALAVIALEMLTGDLPYPSAPATTTLRMIAEAPPRRPSELGVHVPGLDDVFDRAMARRAGDRYPSARELVDALERVLAPMLAASDADPNAGSGVRPRFESIAPAMREPAPPISWSVPMSAYPIGLRAAAISGGTTSIADLPTDEASMVRVGAAIVIAGLTLVGSAFAAGWLACMAMTG
jgi:serine/threonine protein kinase